MNSIYIAPEQIISTAQPFWINPIVADQTSKTISWSETLDMSASILIKHPLTSQWVEIDPKQEWFWTKKWQLAERKVDKELSEGKYEDFRSIDDFFAEI